MTVRAQFSPLTLRQLLADSGEGRAQVSYRTNLVTIVLSGWFLFGLFLDAWAHNNITGLESFFTPWHAVFYSGFSATGAWIAWTVWQNVRAGRRGLAAVPAGYGLAVLAVPVFAVSAVGDFGWHTVYGIEQHLKILFSPTHLGIVAAMVAIVTAPLRAAWADASLPAAPGLRRLLPAVLSMMYGATLVLLFLQYGNALVYLPDGVVAELSDPAAAVSLTVRMVVTNVVLLVPLLVMARRWRIPFGTATLLFAGAAGLSGTILLFANAAAVVSILAAGVCADLLARWLRPSAGRRTAYWAFAALVPFVTWVLYLGVAIAVVGRFPTVVEFWTGAPVVQAMLGFLLGVVLLPNVLPEAVPETAPEAVPAESS